MIDFNGKAVWRSGTLAASLLTTSLLSCANAQSPPTFATVKKDDGQWTMPAKNVASTRYSSLDQINSKNVKDLKVAFTFSTGTDKGAEAPPLVAGDTMYLVTPYPNILFALDLKQNGALKWRYDPKPSRAAQGEACCDVVNRGAVFADGKLIYNTLDNYTVAVAADTGKEVWRTKMGEINKGETMTMAPQLMKDKVLVGDSGGELGVRGWGAALDVKTGKIVWRAYNTGPDKDVLIGSEFKPFYESEKGKDLGVTTWPADQWLHGGGSVWGWASYDPDLNLVYYGVSNPGPWNSTIRPGDNKWTAGIFARDADTGQARWFYQYSPHDLYDYDGVNEEILLDLDWKGQPRKVLVHPDRNGYVYLMDRTNGEVLSAQPFQDGITSSSGVDLKTGRIQYVAAKQPKVGEKVSNICPAPPGAKDWQPSAFSNKTKLLYVPHNNLCFDTKELDIGYIEGTPYVGTLMHMHAGQGGNRGEYAAWDIINGKKVWAIKERFPVWSGTVVTAGDVAFYGTMDGYFKAIDANSGDLLWQFKTGSGIIGQPMTYIGPDGKQYVAILSGVGGWAGMIVSGQIDKRDGTAALGFVNAMKDLPDVTTAGGTLYVFALP
jgi:alcohol dehydrogenase (cytochrome c)